MIGSLCRGGHKNRGMWEDKEMGQKRQRMVEIGKDEIEWGSGENEMKKEVGAEGRCGATDMHVEEGLAKILFRKPRVLGSKGRAGDQGSG
jgi:hypothetical protein